MAKKKDSILGNILKGTADITGEVYLGYPRPAATYSPIMFATSLIFVFIIKK